MRAVDGCGRRSSTLWPVKYAPSRGSRQFAVAWPTVQQMIDKVATRIQEPHPPREQSDTFGHSMSSTAATAPPSPRASLPTGLVTPQVRGGNDRPLNPIHSVLRYRLRHRVSNSPGMVKRRFFYERRAIVARARQKISL